MIPSHSSRKINDNYPGTKIGMSSFVNEGLTSSTQSLNRSLHAADRTRTTAKCTNMKQARAKRAKLLFYFFVKYVNLWHFWGILSDDDGNGNDDAKKTMIWLDINEQK